MTAFPRPRPIHLLAAFALAGCWLLPAIPRVQAQTPDSLARVLAAVPSETFLADSSLRVFNLFKPEALALLGAGDSASEPALNRLVREVYTPYASFWQNYLGDEKAFREWAAGSLFASDHPIHTRLAALLGLRLDSLFTASVAWLVRTTGHRPHGTWYIVFGPGWTDLGGFSDGSMVADFTRMEPDSAKLALILPHELTHMVQAASAAHRADPDSGTVLQRIISEGLASYATWVYANGRVTPARSVGYTEAEWEWALAHERELVAAARPFLSSRSREEVDRFASRSERLLQSAPAAAAYFLGFRILQAYVGRYGPGSWTQVIDLPAREALSRSGYPL